MKETNMEHYRGEIEATAYNFALVDGEVKRCKGIVCTDCDFYTAMGCYAQMVKWLMSEYKPEPVLTAREKHFVEFVQTGYIAKDGGTGYIHWYEERPHKKGLHWSGYGVCTRISAYSNKLFQFITWEDEEPWAVEELRKLKVQND